MTAYEKIYASLAKSLLDDIVNTSDPSSERAVDILAALQKESSCKPMTVSILTNTKIGKCLAKTANACKRHKRTSDNKDDWDEALKTAETLLSDFKDVFNAERVKQASSLKKKKNKLTNDNSSDINRTSSASLAAAEGENAIAAASIQTDGYSRVARRKAAERGKKMRNGKASCKMKNGRSAGSREAAGSKSEQAAALKKTRSKSTNAKNDSIISEDSAVKKGKAKRSSALKVKSKRTNDKNNVNGSELAKHGKAIQSPALKQITAGEDVTPKMMLNSNFPHKRESTQHGKAKQPSPLQQITAEDDASKSTDSSTVNGGEESTELGDKARSAVGTVSPQKRESTPPSIYKACQRVYAKDDATGLLYPAFVRKVMWGPKSNQVNMGFCSLLVDGEPIGGIADRSSDKAMEDEDEDEDARRWDPRRNCYHYYVHYMGWNIKWDRWVEETYLYEDSTSTNALAKLLTGEYNKIKPKKKGQKMSVAQIRKWMERMAELEAEHVRLEKERKLGVKDEDGEGDKDISKEGDVNTSENDHAAGVVQPADSMNEYLEDGTATREEAAKVKNDKRKVETNKKLNKETLRKQAQLRESGLQMKRKRSVSERLTLPFNLKKVLVEEWEVITQCNMVHNLPSQVSVREALNRYLENKLAPLREERLKEISSDGGKKMATAKGENEQISMDEAPPCNKKRKCSALGKEWIDMVENIALFFDQCLPAHLLFAEERGQYNSLRRQILAQSRNFAARAASSSVDDSPKSAVQAKKPVENIVSLVSSGCEKLPCNVQSASAENNSIVTASESSVSSNNNLKWPPPNFLPERMSEIYGCEHLLRLFVRLPAIVAASSTISEMESRRIFSKLGDLVRYLQKHQSQLFCSLFRRPLAGENRGGGGKKSCGK